ncbi:MAG: FAD-binding oxidoreductase, partial [Pseudomonadota bacterium]
MSSETGAAADTIYARGVMPPLPSAAPLPDRADVVIVGGGLTGVSAALHLAEHGFAPCLLEAGSLGDGASGRNGGQLHPGHRQDQITLSQAVGREAADILWRIGGETIALIHALRQRLRADCGFQPGLIEAAHNKDELDHLKSYAEHLHRWHGVEGETLSAAELADAIGTSRYMGGIRDPSGGHLNPFALLAALALAAHVAGARAHTNARVTSVEKAGQGWAVTVETEAGPQEMAADHVLLAGNGLMRGLSREADRRIVPLLNHIVATVPIERLIRGGEAVSDTRFVVRYFRQDAEGRLIFGGGESFGRPRDVGRLVRRALREVYPNLADVEFDAAWSGTLGITWTRMP